jgi:two-component system, chemotaxis family, chemotaxis protein CheY
VRALIVDDSRAMRTILRRLCIESGYPDVTEASDVAAARVAAVDHHPDLVIVDWQLPDGTAVDLVRALRAEGDIAICMVLAPATLTDAAHAGADECVPKPFTGEDLRRRLVTRSMVRL